VTSEIKQYIDGRFSDPLADGGRITVVNPATEEQVCTVDAGSIADVNAAVAAARRSFDSYAVTSREERLELLQSVLAGYRRRLPQIVEAMTTEIGIPRAFCEQVQANIGARHLEAAIQALSDFEFEVGWGTTRILREPIGVCGLISPWNWPMNQIVVKVAPALATGCTMVLKPSQLNPISANLFAEAVHEAGVPAGVFNMVHGSGSALGGALSSHPDVDLVSFCGSTEVGATVATAAAPTIKRVAQELGGKSVNIMFEDVNLPKAVAAGVRNCMRNSGQTCNAPTRMLVTQDLYDEAVAIAAETADALVVGDPLDPETFLGPVASRRQYETVRGHIETGIAEGATLVAGGLDRPAGLERGYFVKPTVFADVSNTMRIAREEIFGPVLCVIPFGDEDEAVAIANDSDFALSGYVNSGDVERARRVARRIRTGMVHINGANTDLSAPFGGGKRSGNGREWGRFGFEDYLEYKSIMGYDR
jgi:aldehyde dehydrogenase (NAD+)